MKLNSTYRLSIIIIILHLSIPSIYAKVLTDEITVNKKANHSGINTVFVVPEEIIHENNIREWEERLLINGYNVVTRDKIKLIFEERNLSQTGMTNNIKVGQLIGADGILFIIRKNDPISRKNEKFYIYQEKLKFVSIHTGEILFIANFMSTNFTHELSESKQDTHADVEWCKTIFTRYKQEISNLSQ